MFPFLFYVELLRECLLELIILCPLTEDNNESSRRNIVHQLEKYTLAEKQNLKEYDAQVECFRVKTQNSAKHKTISMFRY